jgi:hypothetical protein
MLVAGLEGDVEFSDVGGKFTLQQAGIPYSASTATNFNWQGSIRARVGVAVDRFMIYATGGLAYANIDNVYSVTLPSPNLLGLQEVPTQRPEPTRTIGAGRRAAVPSTRSGAMCRHGSSTAIRGLRGTRTPPAILRLGALLRRSLIFTRSGLGPATSTRA